MQNIAEKIRAALVAFEMRILQSSMVIDRIRSHLSSVRDDELNRRWRSLGGIDCVFQHLWRKLLSVDCLHLHSRSDSSLICRPIVDNILDRSFVVDDRADR